MSCIVQLNSFSFMIPERTRLSSCICPPQPRRRPERNENKKRIDFLTEMDTHGSDVSSSFAGNPKDTEAFFVVVFDELGFVNGSDTQLTLDGGD